VDFSRDDRDTGVSLVTIEIQVIDALGVQGRGTSLNTVHNIALCEKELGKMSTILSRHTSYQSNSLTHLAIFSSIELEIIQGRSVV
jgi:hypothetical protein